MSAPEKKPVARPGEPIDGQDAHYLAFVQGKQYQNPADDGPFSFY
jgi:hypothetical protein